MNVETRMKEAQRKEKASLKRAKKEQRRLNKKQATPAASKQ
jgi:hypothetical protein